jgi:hypothetical protein
MYRVSIIIERKVEFGSDRIAVGVCEVLASYEVLAISLDGETVTVGARRAWFKTLRSRR